MCVSVFSIFFKDHQRRRKQPRMRNCFFILHLFYTGQSDFSPWLQALACTASENEISHHLWIRFRIHCDSFSEHYLIFWSGLYFIYLFKRGCCALVVCCLEMMSLSGGFIEHVYLFDLGKASVSSSPQDVSSVHGKSLQWVIPPADYRQGTSRRGFQCWEHQ